MPKKTLGEVLADLGMETPAQTDSGYAADLFPPTYSAGQDSIPGGPDEGAIAPAVGQTDISMAALGAFSQYAQDNIAASNTYSPTDTQGMTVPGTRGNTLGKAIGTKVYLDETASHPEGSARGKSLPSLRTTSGYLDNTEENVSISGILDKTGAQPDKLGSVMLRNQKGTGPSRGAKSDPGYWDKGLEVGDTSPVGGVSHGVHELVQIMMNTENKYSPGKNSPFVNGQNRDGEAALTGGQGGEPGHLFSLQDGNFGKFDPKGTSVTVRGLRKAAIQLLLKASNADDATAKSAAQDIYDKGFGLAAASMIIKPFGLQSGGPHIFGISVGEGNLLPIDKLRIRATKAAGAFGAVWKGSADDDIIAVKSYGSNGPNKQSAADFLPDPNNLGSKAGGSSYGNLNNPSEPFGDFISLGMVFAAITSMLFMAVMGFIFTLAMSILLIIPGQGNRNIPEEPWNMTFGSGAPVKGRGFVAKFLQIFGIPRMPEFGFFDILVGILVLYGVPFTGGKFADIMGDIVEALINLMFGPGFYVVMSRRVMGDWDDVATAFNRIGGSGGANNVTSALAFIKTIFTSKTIRFFFLSAWIGWLHRQSRNPGQIAHGGTVIPLQRQSVEQRLTPGNRTLMTRWHNPAGTVVGTHSLHTFNSALFVGPWSDISINASISDLNDINNPNGIIAGVEELPAARRMTPEELEEVESRIDGEYVPFSIHDVRTNEIISLPAFVSDIQDDFNAEYGTSHGFGRTDPVHIYTKTTRNVGFTFTLVAMNGPDHEYMWYVINRLVAMCYPQRDRGIKRVMSDGKPFIQPFSQTVAASPLVRIRLGDVLGSNSSQRSFERIFGGAETLTAPPEIAAEDQKAFATAISTLNSSRKRIRGKYKSSLDFTFMKSGKLTSDAGLILVDPIPLPQVLDIKDDIKAFPVVLKKGTVVYCTVDGTGGGMPSLSIPPSKKTNLVTFVCRHAVKATLETLIEVGKINVPDPINAEEEVERSVAGWSINIAEVIVDRVSAMALGGEPLLEFFDANMADAGPTFPPPFPPAATMLVFIARDTLGECPIAWKLTEFMTAENIDAFANEHHASLGPAGANFIAATAEVDALGGADGRSSEELGTFLGDGNPLIRAFKSSGGKGLAGFIQQMSLGYNDKLWGTTFEQGAQDKGLRAPKVVDVTISFAPVHDFPLGLDEFGQMFAPSHPVGVQSMENSNDFISADEKLIKVQDKAKAAISYLPPVVEPPG